MINGQLFIVAHIPTSATNYAWGGVLPTMPRHASRCPTRDPLSDAPHPCIDGFAHRAPLLRPFARSRRVRPCSRSPVCVCACAGGREATGTGGNAPGSLRYTSSDFFAKHLGSPWFPLRLLKCPFDTPTSKVPRRPLELPGQPLTPQDPGRQHGGSHG